MYIYIYIDGCGGGAEYPALVAWPLRADKAMVRAIYL